jgi:hypothetical protein
LSLTLFKSSLGSQGIDLSLSILCLLLEFSQALHLSLLLFFDPSKLSLLLLLSLCLRLVIFYYLIFKIFLFLLLAILDIDGSLVGLFNLTHEFVGSILLL